MLNFLRKNRSGKAAVAALAAVTVFSLAGCGGEKAAAPQATLVKSMQVIKRDTPLVYDYTGFVQAQQEMELKAQVSGQITASILTAAKPFRRGRFCTRLTRVPTAPTFCRHRQTLPMPVLSLPTLR